MSSERNLAADDRVMFDADGFIVGLKPSANRENRMAAFTRSAASGLYSLATPDGVSVPLGGVSLAGPLTLYCSSEVVSRTSVNGAGDAAKQPLHSFVLPAGILGPNGRLLFEVEGSSVNAGTRQISVGYLDGSTVVDLSVELSMTSTNTNYEQTFKVYNTSMTAQKYRGSLQHNGASAAGFNTAAMDTTVDQTLVVAGRWLSATSGGTIRCEAVHVTAIYGA